MTDALRTWGWDDAYEKEFAPFAQKGLHAARVTAVYTHIYTLNDGIQERHADVMGRLRFSLSANEDFPCVGDFVAIAYASDGRARIHAVMSRRTLFARKMPRQDAVQALCANIDTVFILMSLNKNFNVKRLERFVSAAHGSGAQLVVVLNKADLVSDVLPYVAQVRAHVPSLPVHVVSCQALSGLEALAPYLREGRTIAAVGSSGVGKSTLFNVLSGQSTLAVGDIREDDEKGRHTTTHRQMVRLPSGALYIDTPGLREMALWQGSDVGVTFHDIEERALRCRFDDCAHDAEPGCAVQAAVADGTLSAARLAHYQRLKAEQEGAGKNEKKRGLMEEKRRAHRAMGGKEKKRGAAARREQDIEDGLALHEQRVKEEEQQ